MSAERNTHDIELLSAYLDGQLIEAERSALESRLQNEPELRQQLVELRATVALIREMPTLAAPRDFRLTHAMVSVGRQRQQPRTYLFSFVSAAAAIVLFVLGFGLLSSSMSTTAPLSSSNFASDGLAASSQPPQVAILPTQTAAATVDAFSLRFAATDIIEQEETLDDQAGEDARTAADSQQAQNTIIPPATMLLNEPLSEATTFAGGEAASNTGAAIEEYSAASEASDEEAPQAELLLQAPAESDTAAAAAPLPTQSEAPAMLALQPTDKPTEMPAPTLARPTVTPLPTETASLPPTGTPTDTPAPTSTPLPTPVPQPLQPPASPSDTGALGVILIAGSIVLLAAAVYLFLRSRR